MLRQNPDYKVPKVDFEYDNDGHYLHYTHPLFTGKGDFSKLTSAVNWSPPFQGLPRSAARAGKQSELDWYQSLNLFQEALEQPNREWEFTI
jgi:gamma-butyrobetaine dioxygenase